MNMGGARRVRNDCVSDERADWKVIVLVDIYLPLNTLRHRKLALQTIPNFDARPTTLFDNGFHAPSLTNIPLLKISAPSNSPGF
jgi:hypothetical protein